MPCPVNQTPPLPGPLQGRTRLRRLVLATLVQSRQDHQVRKREQPLVSLPTRRRCRARDKSDMPSARETVEMLEADAREGGSFHVREDLLARLDFDHAFTSIINLRERPTVRRWRGAQREPLVLCVLLLVRTIAADCGLSIE